MRVLIAPDSFKGSASSRVVAEAIAAGLRAVDPAVATICVPIADGGEGSAEAITAILGGELVTLTALDPLDRPVSCAYGWVADKRLAVVEVATASGLPLMGDRPDPALASSFGTGEQIRDALDRGAEHLILCLGGSATVDAGTGIMAALGARFLDDRGRPLRPSGAMLGRIVAMDLSGLDPRLRSLRITIASDVSSPLLGPGGAVYLFGPQKGIPPARLAAFEAAMARFAGLVVHTCGVDRCDDAGSGAAGGIGFLLRSVLGETVDVRDGFQVIAGLAGLRERIESADLVITGQGHLDAHALVGKVSVSLARLARPVGVPVAVIAGGLHGDHAAFRDMDIAAAVPIVEGPTSLEQAMTDAPALIERAAARLMTMLALGRSLSEISKPDTGSE